MTIETNCNQLEKYSGNDTIQQPNTNRPALPPLPVTYNTAYTSAVGNLSCLTLDSFHYSPPTSSRRPSSRFTTCKSSASAMLDLGKQTDRADNAGPQIDSDDVDRLQPFPTLDHSQLPPLHLDHITHLHQSQSKHKYNFITLFHMISSAANAPKRFGR